MARPSRGGFRADVQAMRALAVTGVVLNHLWPNRLTGGYVGVDIFFVISGYLISLHLLREQEATGTVDLVAFYVRRIRRLLPAALLVIAVTLIAMLGFVPVTVWDRNVGEATASTLYVENFQLVRLSVDYMAHDQAASAFQHYWSLSVEEQFYLLWPMLFLASTAVARRLRRPLCSPRAGLLAPVQVGILLVVLASLVVSVVQTTLTPVAAYFLTWTRAWEFGVGGLVGVMATRSRMRSRSHAVPPRPLLSDAASRGLCLAGWLAMALAMVAYGEGTPIPGAAALLPVLGAAAVIAAGEGRNRAPLASLIRLRPVQLLGDVSYSVYLWHWPLIVVLPYVMATSGRSMRLSALVLTAVLAWLTRRFVEVRGQRAALLRDGRRRVFALTAAAMAVVVGIGGGIALEGARRTADAAERLSAAVRTGDCLGAAALDARCGDPYRRPLIEPVSAADEDFHPGPPCELDRSMTVADWRPRTNCDFSGGDKKALSVWLIGDSHAQMYLPALAEAARREKWRATGIAIGGCLPFDVRQSPRGIPGRAQNVCPRFGPAIDAAVRHERPDVVIVSVASHREFLDDASGRGQDEQYRDAMRATFGRWATWGVRVLGLTDNPVRPGVLDPQCTNEHLADLSACSIAREDVVRPGPFERSLDWLARSGQPVSRIDLIDHICDRATCRSVVGGVNVLHDTNHIGAVYSRTLGPYLAAAVQQQLGH